jgi:hypothetical protein
MKLAHPNTTLAALAQQVDGFFGGGSIDPYIRVLWNDEEVERTEHKLKSRRPRFDHHVKLNFIDIGGDIEAGEEPDLEGTLRFELWDWDGFGGDDLVRDL